MVANKQPLILGGGVLDDIPVSLASCVEPAFPVTETTDLRFHPIFRFVLGDYFCHCVSRNPHDLLSHVRRIYFIYEYEPESEMFPAVLDLFIALGGKGLALRKRMLALAKSRLAIGHYKLLLDALVSGVDERQIGPVSGAFLQGGVEGSLTLVRVGSQATDGPRDPLVEAREFLEYSQLDEARILLEEAILLTPQRLELHEELLDIYRSTRDEMSFFQMLEELDGIENPALEKWQGLAEFFRSRNG